MKFALSFYHETCGFTVKINTYNICMLRGARASCTGEHDGSLIVRIPIERRGEKVCSIDLDKYFAMEDRLMKSVM